MHEVGFSRFTRRSFLAGAGSAFLACMAPGSLWAKTDKLRWRMAVPWSIREKVLLQGADRFVKQVSLLSESRLAISLHAAGTLAGAGEILEAVRSGEADCGQIFAYELAGESPAAEWFFSVPFGLTPDGLNHWFYAGEGLPLLNEVARKSDLAALPMGDTGPRPFGWFSEDFGGLDSLRASVPGRLAAAVLQQAGAKMSDFSLSQGPEDLYREKIDMLGSRGAYLDMSARFNSSARRLYLPFGLTPTGRMLFIINRDAYGSLPAILRKLLQAACAQEDLRLQADLAFAESEARHRTARSERSELARVPAEAAESLAARAPDALAQVAKSDGLAAKVHGKYQKYLADICASSF